MRVAAAAVVALPAAAAAGGWYSLGAVVLGLSFVYVVSLLPCGHPGPDGLSGWPRFVLDGTRSAVRIALLGLFAAAFGRYLVAQAPAVAATLFVTAVAVADVAGLRISRYVRAWFGALLVTSAVVFVVACLAIAPVGGVAPVRSADPTDLLLAIAVSAVLFDAPVPAGKRGGRGCRPVGTAVLPAVTALAVAAAAMYQLGPTRFGLSVTSLRDALVAAEAGALLPMLGAAVALATAAAALDALRNLRATEEADGLPWQARAGYTALGALVAAGLAALLGTVSTLLVVAALVLAEALVRALLSMRRRRATVPVAVVLAAGVLLVVLPPHALLTATALGAVCVLVVAVRRSRATPVE